MLAHILTPEEYDELKSTSPDQLLRDTNANLQTKVEELQTKLKQGSFDNCTIDTPFQVTDDTMNFRSHVDFVIFWNGIATQHNLTLLNAIDTRAFEFLESICNLFGYTHPFKSVKELKRYRTNLKKKNMYEPKGNKLIKVESTDEH